MPTLSKGVIGWNWICSFQGFHLLRGVNDSLLDSSLHNGNGPNHSIKQTISLDLDDWRLRRSRLGHCYLHRSVRFNAFLLPSFRQIHQIENKPNLGPPLTWDPSSRNPPLFVYLQLINLVPNSINESSGI